MGVYGLRKSAWRKAIKNVSQIDGGRKVIKDKVYQKEMHKLKARYVI